MLIELKKVPAEKGKTLQNTINILASDGYEALEHLMYVVLPMLIGGDVEGNKTWVAVPKDFSQLVKVLTNPKKEWYFTINKHMVLRQGTLERVLRIHPYKIKYSSMQPYEEELFKNLSFLTSKDSPLWVEFSIFQGRTQHSFILKHSGLYREKGVSIVAVPNSIIPPGLNLDECMVSKELRKVIYYANKKEHQLS